MECVNENVFLSVIMHLLFCSTDDPTPMPLIHYDHVFTGDGESASFTLQAVCSSDLRATLRSVKSMESRKKGLVSLCMAFLTSTHTGTYKLVDLRHTRGVLYCVIMPSSL